MNSEINKILSISPVDGRYKSVTQPLSEYFSEFALIKYRVYVEIEYFLALTTLPIKDMDSISPETKKKIKKIYQDFSENDALRIKEIEKEINHDVKAVEYFIKEEFEKLNLEKFKEFIHFGLTSQDINNTAILLMIKNSISEIIISNSLTYVFIFSANSILEKFAFSKPKLKVLLFILLKFSIVKLNTLATSLICT